MKKILVLGSNSFSGSSFVDFLPTKKYKIYCFSRSSNKNEFNRYYLNGKKVFSKKIDISKDLKKILSLIKKIKPNYLINFISESMVAESWIFPKDWYYLNSYILPSFYHEISNYKFIEKVIHFSTPEVYGSTRKKIKETNLFNPSTPYGVSRVTADQACNTLFKSKKFPVIITRASNVYGEYQKLYRIIPKTIVSIINKKKIPLHGGGKSVRNFIHIDDVSNALLIIIEKGIPGETYHIASNKMTSIKEIVNLISKKLGTNLKNSSKISKDRVGKDQLYFLNSSKLRNLGWKPHIDLNKGIDRVIRWIRVNKKKLTKHKLYYEHK